MAHALRSRQTLLALVVLVALSCGLVEAVSPINASLRVALLTQTFTRDGLTATNRRIVALVHTAAPAEEGAMALLDLPPRLGLASPVSVPLVNVGARAAAAEYAEYDTVAYWGEGPTVPAGQPRVRRPDRGWGPRYTSGASGLADPARLAVIPAEASAQGTFHLRLGRSAEVTVPVTEANDFLGPVEMVAPARGRVDFSQPIAVAWAPLPRTVAWRVTASARAGDGRIVLWENAWRSDSWQQTGVEQALRDHKVLPASQTNVTIPAMIFMGGPVLLQVTAISASARGKDAVQAEAWAQSTTSLDLTAR